MPRKAPGSVTEHRITFGNKERGFIEEQMKQARTNAIIQGVGSGGLGLGVVVVGGGIALAAFAFYRWAGLTDLPGKILGGIVGAGTAIGETILGTTVETQVDKFVGPLTEQMETLKAKCTAALDAQRAIIADPQSSENQKAQATIEGASISQKCAKAKQQIQMKMKAGMDDVAGIATEGTWLEGMFD